MTNPCCTRNRKEWQPDDDCLHCPTPAGKIRPKSVQTAVNHRTNNRKRSVESGLRVVGQRLEVAVQKYSGDFAQPHCQRPQERRKRSRMRFSPGFVSRIWSKTHRPPFLKVLIQHILPKLLLWFNVNLKKKETGHTSCLFLSGAGDEARTRLRTHKSYAFAGPPTSLIKKTRSHRVLGGGSEFLPKIQIPK